MTLHSYRLAFELERRIHRVDGFRIPVSYGIPLVGLAYGAVAAVLVVMAARMPVLGQLLSGLPWPVRLVLLPAAAAHFLCRTRPDGRPAHEAIAARVRRRLRARRLTALARASGRRAWLEPVTMVPDERGPEYRRGVVPGPGTALLRLPAEARVRRRILELTPVDERPLFRAREVRLVAGQRLVLR